MSVPESPGPQGGPPRWSIDPALAQAIVDRSMAIIDCNINVMDARGVIVASGDAARLGQIHDAALLVIARQAPVEIGARTARQFGAAARPGVNLPLHVGGAVVGCVGLTGTPASMRPYAELVRMAAETMLEQARQTRMVSHDARLREELVLSLVRGETPLPALMESAARLGVDLHRPRIAAILEVRSDMRDASALLGELQRLITLLRVPEAGNLVASLSLTEMVVLMPALNARGAWSLDWHRARAARLLARATEATGLSLRLALGRYFDGPDGLARSCRIARATLAVGRRLYPDRQTLFYQDMRLPVLLDGTHQDWRAEELRAPLRPLIKDARHAPLLRTLTTWLAHGMQQAATAQALDLHRNSLDYRLKQIERICGVDLTRTEDIVALYLALQLAPPGG
ncbi:carbohydrate diacid regulon transcriptional regulator CdaR [Gluconacetobacter azotocaptans]|uniref:Carbohydrate diacid regulon transcriptional regulator CdaR n=1 Tax=Gluconacetobacter azotocaptans TaxID=142834 RepID=A0A7W4PCB2_9PROT|nr:sugar diacid recognition domain-containing protein [Gluconacetobacter azotocaptans]MBB2189057.1 carbohydrate diacid regulon transcriptional regulator CdaR [Gluconacetobacter azotocaptans]GBQ27002.1 sugar diacid utilization regulator [Gluconacetobacter azotocaptans DSM 13594]